MLRGALRRRARRPPPDRQPLALDRLRHGPQRVLAPRERRAARRRRAHRALLDRLGHEARDGGRDRARVGVPRAGATTSGGARGLRGRAPADRRVARSARRRAASSGSRASSATWARTPRHVRVQPAHAQPPDHATASCSCATPGFVASVDAAFDGRPPMFTPLRLRGARARPTASSSRRWTCTRRSTARRATSTSCTSARAAIGGAGLVMTEMICVVAPTGGSRPGCGGLYRDEHTAAWKRIVDFVHAHWRAKIGAQLGHAGRKGSTKLHVGGRGRAAGRGQLAADRAVAAALPARASARCRAR